MLVTASPSIPWFAPNIISQPRKPPERRFLALPVSAKMRHRRRRTTPPSIEIEDDMEEIGGFRHAVLASLDSDPPSKRPNPVVQADPETPPTTPSNTRRQRKQQQQESREMSGSDVLLALQRAAAQRNRSTRKKKEMQKGRESSSVTGSKTGGCYSSEEEEEEVRPICIKSDWAARLDELERRLGELADTH